MENNKTILLLQQLMEKDKITQCLQKLEAKNLSLAEMLNQIIEIVNNDEANIAIISRLCFMAAFDLSLSSVNPIGGWLSGELNDQQLEELIGPYIYK